MKLNSLLVLGGRLRSGAGPQGDFDRKSSGSFFLLCEFDCSVQDSDPTYATYICEKTTCQLFTITKSKIKKESMQKRLVF